MKVFSTLFFGLVLGLAMTAKAKADTAAAEKNPCASLIKNYNGSPANLYQAVLECEGIKGDEAFASAQTGDDRLLAKAGEPQSAVTGTDLTVNSFNPPSVTVATTIVVPPPPPPPPPPGRQGAIGGKLKIEQKCQNPGDC